jgi:hypothetical protein
VFKIYSSKKVILQQGTRGYVRVFDLDSQPHLKGWDGLIHLGDQYFKPTDERPGTVKVKMRCQSVRTFPDDVSNHRTDKLVTCLACLSP